MVSSLGESTVCAMWIANESSAPFSIVNGVGVFMRVHSGFVGSVRYTGRISCWKRRACGFIPRTSMRRTEPGVAPCTEKWNQVRDRATYRVPSQSRLVHTMKELAPDCATWPRLPVSKSESNVSPPTTVRQVRERLAGGLLERASIAAARAQAKGFTVAALGTNPPSRYS